MAKKKDKKIRYYAVKYNNESGVYTDLNLVFEKTRGISNAVVRRFNTRAEAEEFLGKYKEKKATKKQRYYVVTVGKKTGVYLNSEEARTQMRGVTGSHMKMFKDEKKAYEYLNANTKENKNEDVDNKLIVQDTVVKSVMANHVFVDGSFNTKTKTYGYGGILFCNKGVYTFKGKGQDKRFQALGSLSGELLAATEAIKLAIEIGLEEITIMYDCEAIELYSQRKPKGNVAQSQYKNFIDNNKNSLRIYFKKVKAHDGIEGNEMADILAKSASGAKLKTKEKMYLQLIENISHRI